MALMTVSADVGSTVTPEFFRALGDQTRLRLMSLLANAGKPLCVCEMVYGVQIPQYRASKHLSVLSRFGLVKAAHRGTWVRYSLAEGLPAPVADCLYALSVQEPYASDLARLQNRMLLRNSEGLCTVGFAPEDQIETLITQARKKDCCR